MSISATACRFGDLVMGISSESRMNTLSHRYGTVYLSVILS